ncbi:MAG: hypothetical protein H7Z16_11820 [Pyrinomonadaceae bacterium]|nr:hypothetical protein [Pyrinomonadaceae bacterium]
MTTNSSTLSDSAKAEYEAGLEQFRLMSNLRRQDMAFATTVQAAVFTIVGSKLLQLNFSDFLLSAIAFFVLLLGLNSERRLAAYMTGYMKRVLEIEAESGMSMFCGAGQVTQKRRFLVSNAIVFPFYYCVFVFAWLVVWTLNLWKRR